MKILITTDFYFPIVNGVVTSVRHLKRELKSKGHDVRVLTLRQPNQKLYQDTYYIDSFSANKIYPKARIANPFSKSAIKEIIQWSPDIVHSQAEFTTYMLANSISKKLNIPLIHTYHTAYEDYTHYIVGSHRMKQRLVARLTKKILNNTDHVIAPTQKVKTMLSKYAIEKPIDIIPTGIDIKNKIVKDKALISDLRKSLGIGEAQKILLSLGRLGKEKNVEELINYFKRLKRDNIVLVVVGDGPDKKRLESYAKKLNLDKSVIFVGMVDPDQVSLYYNLADVFVSASTSETQGLTYIEALSCGLPTLCRKDDCLENVVTDYYNGFMYNNFNDFHLYLNKLCYDEVIYNHLSENAITHSQIFTSKKFAENVACLYERVVERTYKNDSAV